MLPAGFRQRDQTKKTPTGDYDRDALQDYLEKSALELEDREDLVPFTREKKGRRSFPRRRDRSLSASRSRWSRSWRRP
ncbi:hypothetical protein CRUP_000121 [Coryphaenoides rupestris]|nr:hypothetical protein CRUP_000121 [Coryphaenoides rupestris]